MNLLKVFGYIIILLVIGAMYKIMVLIDKDPEQKEIEYLFIPKLTRVIISIDSIHSNFRSNIGDIIETSCDNNGKRSYYIHSYGGYYKLTYKQISRLESDYSIRII